MRLAGDKVVLREFAQEHLTENYVSWLNDSETMKFSENRHRNHTLESCTAYFQSFQGTPHFFFAIELDGLHVGNINAYVDRANETADVGILIGERSAWGKGVGLDAWRTMCRFLLEQGVRKITAGTAATNLGMVKIFQKSGMVEDGVRRKQLLIDGEAVDIVYAALFRPE